MGLLCMPGTQSATGGRWVHQGQFRWYRRSTRKVWAKAGQIRRSQASRRTLPAGPGPGATRQRIWRRVKTMPRYLFRG